MGHGSICPSKLSFGFQGSSGRGQPDCLRQMLRDSFCLALGFIISFLWTSIQAFKIVIDSLIN